MRRRKLAREPVSIKIRKTPEEILATFGKRGYPYLLDDYDIHWWASRYRGTVRSGRGYIMGDPVAADALLDLCLRTPLRKDIADRMVDPRDPPAPVREYIMGEPRKDQA